MHIPFKYGQVVKGDNFTNRKEEIKLLSQNFMNLVSTILISPRRWGKSSLVRKAAEVAQNKDKSVRVCFLDLYKVRTEEEFYELLTYEVIKVTTGKISEVTDNVKKFFKHFMPQISFSPMQDTEFKLGLNWADVKKNPEEILNLAETIAKQKKIKLIVCLDEFQNIGYFKASLAFQKRLRSSWQNHSHVAYCMYGSKRHMMLEVFTSRSMPFYQFGSLMLLEKIKEGDWLKYIQKQFAKTDKTIEKAEALLIAQLMDNHPYYVQQLAHLTWLNTELKCKEAIVRQAHDQLLRQLSLLFQNLTDSLSNRQLNFLKALIANADNLSSAKTMSTYGLGTSATVNRSKNALIDQEILDNIGGQIQFVDPAYKAWLTQYYFR